MKRIITFFIACFNLAAVFSLPALADEVPISRIFSQQANTIVVVGAVDGRDEKMGTGFVIKKDGLILTNYHVVQRAKEILVKLQNGTIYRRARLVNFDPLRDIALIKIDGVKLQAVCLGDSSAVEIGQRVVTIGNPLGLENTVADGLISALRDTRDAKMFQISVPLSQGSSGGPLFNLRGEVIGITVSSYLKGQNLNFAIPINYAQILLAKTDTSEDMQTASRSLSSRRLQQYPMPLALAENGDYKIYIVKHRDTLFSLAKRFSTTVDDIVAFNRLSGSKIYAGQSLKIPLSTR